MPFVRYTRPDLNQPGTFVWSAPDMLQPAAQHHYRKVVVIVDESRAAARSDHSGLSTK